MLESFEKIPKGVNLILFIWAAVGLFFMLRDAKVRKEKIFYACLAMIAFMIFWRTLIRLISSRYAICLILPLTVSAAYLVFIQGKRRHVLVRVALSAALAVSGFLFLKMNTNSVFRNYSSNILSEMFKDIESSREKHLYVASWKDFSRVYYASRLGDSITSIRDKDIHDYVVGYRNVYPDVFFNVESRSIADDPVVLEMLRDKQVASLIDDTDKNKKQYVYLLSSENKCVPVSESRIAPLRPNLLENGGLEQLDSPEESYGKLKAHVEQYAMLRNAGESIRTPRNAFFHTAPGNGFPPEFNTQESGAIDGNRSVWIGIPDGSAGLMFDQRFSNGKYDYSMLGKGKTGTRICIFFEAEKNGSRETVPVATFTIPDKRLFRITSKISVDDLDREDGFRVGVSVRNGEAYFDDFSVTPSETDEPPSPVAD